MKASDKEDLIMSTGDITFIIIVAAAFTVFGVTLAILSSR